MDNTLLCKQNSLHRLAMGIFGLWCLYLAFRNFTRIRIMSGSFSSALRFPALAAACLAALLCILISWLLAKPLARLRLWQTALIIFAFSLALKLLVIFTIAPAEYSDFQTFRAGAALTAKGDVSFIERLPYYKIWAYQFGIEFLIAPIFKLFGRWDPVFGLVVNGFIAAACSPLLYLIAEEAFVKGGNAGAKAGASGKTDSAQTGTPKAAQSGIYDAPAPDVLINKASGRRAAVFAALSFTLLPITIDLSAVFTNQQLSLFFLLLALWIFLKMPWWLGGLLAGTALGLANVARADAIVWLAAFFVGVILLDRSKKTLLGLGCLILMYFVCFRIVEYLASPLQPYGLGNNFPLYKFAVGLDEENLGRYSLKMQKLLFDNEAYLADSALRDRETLALIKEELSIGPARLLRLFLAKIDIQWTNIYHSYEILHDISAKETVSLLGRSTSGGAINRDFGIWEDFSRVFLFGAAGISGLIAAAKKKIHLGLSVPVLAFMAFSVIALFTEVQYRYTYFVFPAPVLMSAALLTRSIKAKASEKAGPEMAGTQTEAAQETPTGWPETAHEDGTPEKAAEEAESLSIPTATAAGISPKEE